MVKKLRVVAYLRRSTKSQSESIEDQRAAIATFVPEPHRRLLEPSGQGDAGFPGTQRVAAGQWGGHGFVNQPLTARESFASRMVHQPAHQVYQLHLPDGLAAGGH